MYQTKSEVIPRLQKLIEYSFTNAELGWEAIQAKGVGGYPEGNKRLALIGDAYLKLKLLHLWYPTRESIKIGNDNASIASNNANLARLGKASGLEAFVNSNPSQLGVVTDAQIADSVEAIIGAVYEDGGEGSLTAIMKKFGLL